jgi:hypothetical protein
MTAILLALAAMSVLASAFAFALCFMAKDDDLMASGLPTPANTTQARNSCGLPKLTSDVAPTDFADSARHSLIEATQPKPNTLPQWLAIQGVVK